MKTEKTRREGMVGFHTALPVSNIAYLHGCRSLASLARPTKSVMKFASMFVGREGVYLGSLMVEILFYTSAHDAPTTFNNSELHQTKCRNVKRGLRIV
jgi:hypothetical protein